MYSSPFKALFCGTLLFSVSAFAGSDETASYRSLTAVTRRSHLQARDADFVPRWNSRFHYVDENTLGTGSPFAASLGVSSKLQALALEDIELHLDRIRCSPTAIEISFTSNDHCQRAQEAWKDLSSFFVITSHPGCNYDGERMPYLVSSVTFFEGRSTAILATQVVDWEDTFHSITVDFGVARDMYLPGHVRRHASLQRRQYVGTVPASSPTSATSVSRVFPTAPTVLPSATSLSKENFNFSVIETQIFPPPVPGASVLLPQGWTVSCKNCSGLGSIELTHGTTTVSSNKSSSILTLSGFVNFTMDNFAAHIELETAVQATQQLKEFAVHLSPVPIPLSPFQIPGVAVVGVSLDPVIIASVSLGEALNFTYGFDLTVPDGSYISLNVGNLQNSSTAGFDKTEIAPLPLRATTPSISLTFQAAFRPQLLVGVTFFKNLGATGLTFFLDLPQLTVAVKPVANVLKSCAPATDAPDAIGNALGHVFGNLTLVEPSVGLDVGVGFELLAGALFPKQMQSATTDWTITSTAFPLPTKCLSYGSGGVFAVASDPPVSTTAKGTGAGSTATATKKGGAGRIGSLFGGRWGVWGGVVLVVVEVAGL